MTINSKFFIAFVFFVLFWVIFLFRPFLLTITIGILMAVATASFEKSILNFTNNRKILSAFLITLFVCVFFLVPLFYAIIATARYITNFDISNITNTLNFIKNYNFNLPEPVAFLEPKIKEAIASINVNSAVSNIFSYMGAITKGSASFLIDMGLIIVFYFFANLYGQELVLYLKKVVPMKTNDLDYILTEVANTMSVVVYSMIANIILQGSLFAFIVSFYGYNVLLMGILFAFSSLIPAIGGALIYVPLCIFEVAHANISGAIVIFLYSVIVISTIADNIIKPLIISFINKKMVKKPANINEILIFFSMFAGITTFGFWGIVLGPAIVTFFLSTIKLYILLKEREIV